MLGPSKPLEKEQFQQNPLEISESFPKSPWKFFSETPWKSSSTPLYGYKMEQPNPLFR